MMCPNKSNTRAREQRCFVDQCYFVVFCLFLRDEAINYNGEVQVASLCAYEGCVVCVHFRTLTNSTLEYALHLYEDENPGQKGLDIGFRRPREFFYDPEMDRQLWERAYKMQVALNSAFLRQRDKEDMVNITMRSFPVPAFPEDVLRYRYGFFWLASTTFLFPMYRIISRLCFENNSGLREYQLMMGLGNCFYWTGHFACAFCFFVVHSAICVYGAVGCRHFDTGAPYLDHTDPSLLLVVLLLHSVSQILLAMLAACALNLDLVPQGSSEEVDNVSAGERHDGAAWTEDGWHTVLTRRQKKNQKKNQKNASEAVECNASSSSPPKQGSQVKRRRRTRSRRPLPPLPKDDIKIILRPHKGLAVKDILGYELSTAVIDACHRHFDGGSFMLRVHPGSNIIIVSTPHEHVAKELRDMW
ncbi:hypothetical protein HPB51_027845 [Rhipicephalus microplus]|uniref:ABC-2 type transporter transmembrane domain-containing protein n=1 Tax=Rhipicephalus microplus TaxID=6941 RepID=A0A9J6CYY5_RHIMP|nr:hypothetical protein HPB51_027845 [Rhipicephalus microplus]